VDGSVRARVNGSIVTTGSGRVEITADAEHVATADVLVLSGGAFAGAGAGALADVKGTVEASVGSTGSISTSGMLKIGATSNNTATATSNVGTGGLVAIGVSVPLANVRATTTATLAGTVSNAGEVEILADSTNTATSTSRVLAIGLGAASGTVSRATTAGLTEASIGAGSTLTLPGKDVTVTATAIETAIADVIGVTVAGIAVTALLPTAIAGGTTRAQVGQGSTITARDLLVEADATLSATATTTGGALALIGVSVLTADAQVTGVTEAIVGAATGSPATSSANVTLNLAKLTVLAMANATAFSNVIGMTGAAVSIDIFRPDASVAATTRAAVRDNVGGTVGTLEVRAGNPDGDRVTYSASGEADIKGVAFVGVSVATTDITAGGAVEAFVGAP
jgi:hypothetical protein